MEVLLKLRPVAAVLFNQVTLLARLAKVELSEYKQRWLQMLLLSVVALMFGLAMILFLGVLVLMLSWDTPYRHLAALAVVVVYAAIAALAVQRVRRIATLSQHAFSATREELAADVALLKQKLWP